jgi:hypothetical protein
MAKDALGHGSEARGGGVADRLAAARSNPNHPLGALVKAVSAGTPIAGIPHNAGIDAATGPRPVGNDLSKVHSFVAGAQGLVDANNANYPNTVASGRTSKLEIRNPDAPKYIAIDRNDYDKAGNKLSGSVHAFVDRTTGDVLKPSGYKVPAKGARGNIFDENNGLGHMGSYGPAYKDSRGRIKKSIY